MPVIGRFGRDTQTQGNGHRVAAFRSWQLRSTRYAVEAFRLEAMDYLLKPVDKDRVSLTIERAQRIIEAKQSADKPVDSLPEVKPALQRTKLLVRSANRNLIVDANDVIYATIDDGTSPW